MQIGIDVGATKIESVVLEEDGNEKHRSRTSCPKDYLSIVNTIKEIYKNLEKEFKKNYLLIESNDFGSFQLSHYTLVEIQSH